ncbi:helix-turn-helix domain-containing protein [Mucilaginibacter pocheonensis]|uniref:AraC-like DNA-binding protein n=1 Tax=Mucilaginibacter pocheonensis TaxID=398050 RepID=A0ABU1TAA1_9SPHI|nr:helix-turn-helix domain-containing protein [Mucilaginibacter pocheonensis]MDR6942272.1 AraC-like DNA-binding protein [Mucilaginibacter pocheonensis]
MFQQFYKPHPALKEFVNNIMIHEVKLDAIHTPRAFPIPPLPEHCLMFYVRDAIDVEDPITKERRSMPSSIVIGPNLNRHIMIPGRHHLMIKVGFQAGGLYRLLGIPMSELLCNDEFDGLDLLGSEMNEVNDRLGEAVSFFEMKTIVEEFLLRRSAKLKQLLPIDHVLPLLIKEQGLLKIDLLASEACLSIRQFERVFQQRIGLSPKHFSRLVRFAQAWIIKEQHPGISWIKVANECRYFDQMHLIRDFREFAGANPSVIEQELLESQTKFFNRLFH